MMIRSAMLVSTLALLTTAVPAFGSTTIAVASYSQETTPDSAAIDALFEQIESNPRAAISQIDKMLEVAPTEAKILLWSMRGIANVKRTKPADARRDFATAHALDPVSHVPARLKFLSGLWFDNIEFSSEGLDELIAVAPDSTRELEPDLVYAYLRQNKTAHAEDQQIALADLGYQGIRGQDMTREGIKILLARGQTQRAAEMLKHLKDVQIAQMMMIDRAYAPLWPAVEASSGDRMASVGQKQLEEIDRELEEKPDEIPVRTMRIEAYSNLNRYSDAIAAGADFATTATALKEVDQDGSWLINAHALALNKAGRRDEAQARFVALIEARPDELWVINLVINRLELLVANRNFDKAMALLPDTERQVSTKGSGYAKQLVRRLKICALAGMGKLPDAVALVPELEKNTNDAEGATVEGLMCAGKIEAAKALAIKILDDKDSHGEALASMQHGPLATSDPSLWDGYWLDLRKDPLVEAAFQRAGRDLPDRFWVR